jgi:hypothetical protein
VWSGQNGCSFVVLRGVFIFEFAVHSTALDILADLPHEAPSHPFRPRAHAMYRRNVGSSDFGILNVFALCLFWFVWMQIQSVPASPAAACSRRRMRIHPVVTNWHIRKARLLSVLIIIATHEDFESVHSNWSSVTIPGWSALRPHYD